MSIFEVKCVVRAAKLPDVLIRLDGMTIEPPMVIPMAHKTEAKAAKLNGTGIPGVHISLKTWIMDNKLKRITGSQARQAMLKRGHKSYFYGIQKLLNEGMLKKSKDRSTYDVVTK